MSIVQKSQKALEYDKILAELAKYAKTEQSHKLCLELTPYIKAADIQKQLILTREAKDVLDLAHENQCGFQGLYEIFLKKTCLLMLQCRL